MNNIFLLKGVPPYRGLALFFTKRRRHRGALYSLAFITAVVFLSACRSNSKSAGQQVCFQNNCVEVEVVGKEEDMRRGLQFRSFLGESKGMLFVFTESARHAFWMKDTLIPLDMIWLDQDQRIVYIERQVPPCAVDPCAVYVPEQNALYVLEINAGHAGDMGLRVGEQMRFLSTSPIRVEGLIQNRG